MEEADQRYASTIQNPGRRLHGMLEAVVNQGAADRKNSVATAWRRALGGIDDEGQYKLFEYLAEVQRLAREVRSYVEASTALDSSFLLHNYGKVETFLSTTNLDQQFGSLESLVADVVVRDVAHIGEYLGLTWSERPIAIKDQSDFLADLDALFESLKESSLPHELRDALLEMAEAMRHALVMYPITGARGFKRALALCVGELTIVQLTAEEHKDSAPMRKTATLMKRLKKFADESRPWVELTVAATKVYLALNPGGGRASLE